MPGIERGDALVGGPRALQVLAILERDAAIEKRGGFGLRIGGLASHEMLSVLRPPGRASIVAR